MNESADLEDIDVDSADQIHCIEVKSDRIINIKNMCDKLLPKSILHRGNQ